MSDAWDWYLKPQNQEALKPLVPLVGSVLTFLGSVIVGVGTITVGYLVARAALRQARTAIEQAKTATEVAQTGNRQADIAGRRHVTDTFSKAVEQLGSEKMEVRIGGIYTLERLAGEALDSPRDADRDLYWTVLETLTAFVRERARWKEPDPAKPEAAANSDLRQSQPRPDEAQLRPRPATDIAAVVAVIQRRPDARRKREELRRKPQFEYD